MWYYIFALVTFEAFASVFSFTPQQVVKSAEGLLIIEKMILKKGGKIMGKQITPMAKARLRVKKDDLTVMSNRYIERLNYTRLSYYLVNCGFFTQWSSVDDRGADFIKVCSTENPGFKSRDECRLKQTVFFLSSPFHLRFNVACDNILRNIATGGNEEAR